MNVYFIQGALAPNLFPDQENMSFSHKPYHILVKQAAGSYAFRCFIWYIWNVETWTVKIVPMSRGNKVPV